jgi:hypothetical protein
VLAGCQTPEAATRARPRPGHHRTSDPHAAQAPLLRSKP